MKVIASQIRKGNVVEVGDQLYAVLKAESFFPGKGLRRPRSTCVA